MFNWKKKWKVQQQLTFRLLLFFFNACVSKVWEKHGSSSGFDSPPTAEILNEFLMLIIFKNTIVVWCTFIFFSSMLLKWAKNWKGYIWNFLDMTWTKKRWLLLLSYPSPALLFFFFFSNIKSEQHRLLFKTLPSINCI